MAVQVVPCKPVEAVVRSAVAHKQREPAAVGAVATELGAAPAARAVQAG